VAAPNRLGVVRSAPRDVLADEQLASSGADRIGLEDALDALGEDLTQQRVDALDDARVVPLRLRSAYGVSTMKVKGISQRLRSA